MRARRLVIPVAALIALAVLPRFAIDIPYVFKDSLNTPGTLQLLALCLVFGGLAMTYDLLFGFTGLLSFGHALYFAAGVYMTDIAITKWHWSFWAAIAFTALIGLVLPLVLGAVSLRVGDGEQDRVVDPELTSSRGHPGDSAVGRSRKRKNSTSGCT